MPPAPVEFVPDDVGRVRAHRANGACTCSSLRLLGARRHAVIEGFQDGDDVFRRIHAREQSPVLCTDEALLHEIVEVDRAAPELAADQHDGDTRHLAGLHQGEHLEQFVERAVAAWEGDQRPRTQQKVHLAQGEIAEAEGKLWADVGVGLLFVRQSDVQTNRVRARLERPPVCRFHDARPPASDDDEVTAPFLLEAG